MLLVLHRASKLSCSDAVCGIQSGFALGGQLGNFCRLSDRTIKDILHVRHRLYRCAVEATLGRPLEIQTPERPSSPLTSWVSIAV